MKLFSWLCGIFLAYCFSFYCNTFYLEIFLITCNHIFCWSIVNASNIEYNVLQISFKSIHELMGNMGNNKTTELRTILQKESQNS